MPVNINPDELTEDELRDALEAAQGRLESEARKARELKAVAKGPLRDATPISMRALEKQQALNQEFLREFSELKIGLAEHRDDSREQTARLERQISELKSETSISNGYLKEIAAQEAQRTKTAEAHQERRTAIMAEVWSIVKKALIGLAGAGGAAGGGYLLFG